MNFKTTLLLLIVLLAVGGYVIFDRLSGGADKDKIESAADSKKLFDVKNKEIAWLNQQLLTAGRNPNPKDVEKLKQDKSTAERDKLNAEKTLSMIAATLNKPPSVRGTPDRILLLASRDGYVINV